MEYVKFGRTNAKVSKIAFGGAGAGIKGYLGDYDPSRKSDREGVIKAMEKAFELGINYFDTAQSYGNGIGESIFGEGLHNLPRKEIFLSSKISSSNHVRASVMESLERIGTDYLDLIQIHGGCYLKREQDMVLQEGGVLEELEKLKAEGFVRAIGFTTEDNNEAVYAFIRSNRFDTMQIRYNLISQHPFYEPFPKYDKEPGSLNFAKQHNMGTCSMRTLTSGRFQKWISLVRPDDNYDYNEALLQFNLSCPVLDVSIVGMRTVDEVVQNVKICNNLDGRVDFAKIYNE